MNKIYQSVARLNALVIVMFGTLMSESFLILSKLMTGHPLVQGFLINLSVDTLVIPLTLTVIRNFTYRLERKNLDPLEEHAKNLVKKVIGSSTTIIGTIVGGKHGEPILNELGTQGGSLSIHDTNSAFEKAATKVIRSSNFKIREVDASLILERLEFLGDEVDKIILKYTNSLTPETFRLLVSFTEDITELINEGMNFILRNSKNDKIVDGVKLTLIKNSVIKFISLKEQLYAKMG